MDALKNCPNCGGPFDDNGRCTHCGSKIYDLTAININIERQDIVRLKIPRGDKSYIVDIIPTRLSILPELNCKYPELILELRGREHNVKEGEIQWS